MIEIDGSYGEGGGQIVRMSLALSAVTGKDVRIINIRAGRKNPGLAAQHLTCIKSVAEMCNAKADGLRLGSQTLTFRPGRLRGGRFHFDIGTAGSITLVFQACLIPAINGPEESRLSVTGGTDVKWSPPIDYFRNIFLPMIQRMGVTAEVEGLRRGYYPKGGGKVVLHVRPSKKLEPLSLDSREGDDIKGISHTSNLPSHISERMAKSATRVLEHFGTTQIQVKRYGEAEAFGQGGAIVLWIEGKNTILGADSIAERGVKAEKVGMTAAQELSKEIRSGATLDLHLSDQILPYMAIAEGTSSFLVRKITEHALTNMWLIEHFLDVRFRTKNLGSLWKVIVEPS